MKTKGFTLIETIIVFSLVAITAGIFTAVMTEANRGFLFLNQQNLIVQEARVAMNLMAQEFTTELVVGPYHTFDTAANSVKSDSLKFTRQNEGGTVTYSWSGITTKNLTFQVNTLPVSTLASNVNPFSFTYLDAARASIATPVTTTNLPLIASIQINMTIQVGSDTITLTSEIAPRNIQIPAQVTGTY